MTSVDIREFLAARWDEIEAVAKAAALAVADHAYAPAEAEQYVEETKQWHARRWLYQAKVEAEGDEDRRGEAPKVTDSVWPEVADHVALNDPAYVLDDVAAKRKILDLYEYAKAAHVLDRTLLVHLGEKAMAEAILQSLAAPFREHPDFDPDWAEPTP